MGMGEPLAWRALWQKSEAVVVVMVSLRAADQVEGASATGPQAPPGSGPPRQHQSSVRRKEIRAGGCSWSQDPVRSLHGLPCDRGLPALPFPLHHLAQHLGPFHRKDKLRLQEVQPMTPRE